MIRWGNKRMVLFNALKSSVTLPSEVGVGREWFEGVQGAWDDAPTDKTIVTPQHVEAMESHLTKKPKHVMDVEETPR